MTTKQADIVIIGAGAAGATLAVLLGQVGFDVALVDPHPPESFKKTETTGRTVALIGSSVQILKATGIWDKLEPLSCPLQTMKIMDVSKGGSEPVAVEFDAQDINHDEFGFNIPNAPLRAALFERVKALKNIKFIEGRFHDYKTDGHSTKVRLDTGDVIQARLLVGADGKNSAVRHFAGIGTRRHDYDQTAITCIINHSRSHQNISTEFHTPAGPTAIVPMPGNQSSIVWVETHEKAEALLHLKKQEFEQALQRQIHDVLGGITLEKGPEGWPLETTKAKDIIAPRLALVAEAAHALPPITAQGLNLSLRDVATLAEILTDKARLGIDIGTQPVLAAYKKRRHLDIDTRVAGVDILNRFVANDIAPIIGARRAGLKTLESVYPLKMLAMRVGLSPRIDESRLARGEAL
ncbi:MAG: FAD-dependent monooxygenase [Alphaproteobacteria bacterium]|nr:FAD-dependent monooxygenase [Alphaproteobacteria bacterium]